MMMMLENVCSFCFKQKVINRNFIKFEQKVEIKNRRKENQKYKLCNLQNELGNIIEFG